MTKSLLRSGLFSMVFKPLTKSAVEIDDAGYSADLIQNKVDRYLLSTNTSIPGT